MKLRWLLLGLLVTLLLVPARLLTTARLLDLPGGTWVRLVAFTPYALVLYAAALLLLLLAWWRGRGSGAARRGCSSCVSLLGLLLHAFWASGPYVGAPAAEAAGDAPAARDDRQPAVRPGRHRPGGGGRDGRRRRRAGARGGHPAGARRSRGRGARPGVRAPRRAAAARAGRDDGVLALPGSATCTGSAPCSAATPWTCASARPARVHLIAVHPRPPIGDVSGWRIDQGVLRHAAAGHVRAAR